MMATIRCGSFWAQRILQKHINVSETQNISEFEEFYLNCQPLSCEIKTVKIWILLPNAFPK